MRFDTVQHDTQCSDRSCCTAWQSTRCAVRWHGVRYHVCCIPTGGFILCELAMLTCDSTAHSHDMIWLTIALLPRSICYFWRCPLVDCKSVAHSWGLGVCPLAIVVTIRYVLSTTRWPRTYATTQYVWLRKNIGSCVCLSFGAIWCVSIQCVCVCVSQRMTVQMLYFDTEWWSIVRYRIAPYRTVFYHAVYTYIYIYIYIWYTYTYIYIYIYMYYALYIIYIWHIYVYIYIYI